jgi:hypothetical protein
MKNLKLRALVASFVAAGSLPVLAASPYAGIISAVSWTDVTAGVIAIAALVAAVLVVMRGSKMLLRMIGR